MQNAQLPMLVTYVDYREPTENLHSRARGSYTTTLCPGWQQHCHVGLFQLFQNVFGLVLVSLLHQKVIAAHS